MKQIHKKNAFIALVFVNLLYGASHVLAKGVMPIYLTPTVFIFLRVTGATFLFWLLGLLLPIEKIKRKDLFNFLACGFFGVAVNQLLFFHGLNKSSPMNAGIIMTFNPIMVALISVVFLKERLQRTQWLGIAIGAIGAIALTTIGSFDKFSTSKGDLFLFGNSLSYAIYLVLAKPLMEKYNPLTVITWVFTIGSILVCLFPATWQDMGQINWDFPNDIWAKIVFVIIGVTFLTYLFTVIGLKYVSSTVASVFIYFQPVFVIAFTYLFSSIGWSEDYSKAITYQKIILMFVVFLGVYLTSNSKVFKNG